MWTAEASPEDQEGDPQGAREGAQRGEGPRGQVLGLEGRGRFRFFPSVFPVWK